MDDETNAIRVFDGSGDGRLGVFIDAYDDVWVVATQYEEIQPKMYAELEAYAKEAGVSVYWKKLSQHQKESPEHLFGPEKPEVFQSKESGVNYEISMHSGYSQGIFLDQRDNRKRVRETVAAGDTVLNTFAYTGAFSVCAALGGATTTTLDLSKPYLDWAKRNFELNGLSPDDHYFCKGDTFHWLGRFQKQGRQFDGIILDPPTFSRDAKGKVFKVEKDYQRLVAMATECLKPGGWLLACTNCRKMSDGDFLEAVDVGMGGASEIEMLDMPEEYTAEDYLKSVWAVR